MKHIHVNDLQGKIKIEKESVADLIELIRVSPVAMRILLLLSVYVDKTNSLITTVKTLNYMLNLKSSQTEYGLRKLAKEGFIDLEAVKLDHKQSAEVVSHNDELYFDSACTIWEVISRERASNFDLTGKYIKVTVNSAVISSTKVRENRVLFKVKDNLFFDKDINENEIDLTWWID